MAASYQSSIQDQISDVTECSICAEVFANPKILPCVHTFCLRCLETYGKEKSPGDQMVCPICRREFLIPKGGFSELPSNFFIGKMVEIGKLAMTPMSKTLCALCPEEDEVLAQMFCVDCEQNLCSRCGNGHKKSRFSQHHQIIKLGCQPRAQDLHFHNSYCGNHPEELIKMYCYEDKVAICLICCVESHQSHRCVNANTAAKEFTEQLKCSSGRVASRIVECEELGEKLDKFKAEFQANVLKTEEGIREAAKKTTKLIQQHTDQLVQRLKSVAERNIKAFETTKQDVDRFRVMIDSYSRYSEKLLTQGSPVDVCRAVDQMLSRAQELETLPANCSGDRFCCDSIVFNPLDIESQLTLGMINAIGELIVIPSSEYLLQFGVQDESQVMDPRVIEVHGIPDTFSDATVTMMFENKRYCGFTNVEVDQLQMLGRGRALLTVKEPQQSSTCSSPENFDEASAKELDQWSRSIVVEDVPEEMCPQVRLVVESKQKGGGNITIYERNPNTNQVLVTFEDMKVAERFVAAKTLNVFRQNFYVRRPLLVEDFKETSTEDFGVGS